MSSQSVQPDQASNSPSLEGKVILITGANTGLGRQTALELAKLNPSHLWMTARDTTKGNAAVADIQRQSPGVALSLLRLDLTSFESIKAAAKQFLASESRLDLLYLNAGILGHPAAVTSEGYEIHMGVNHLGHALLLKLLTPVLENTAAAASNPDAVRVISLSSVGYKTGNPEGIQFDFLSQAEGTTPVFRYTQSKLANLLYAREFARRHPQFITVSMDPGPIATDLFTREPGDEQVRHLQQHLAPKYAKPVEEGTKNQLWAASTNNLKNGTYYEVVGVEATLAGHGSDDEMAAELWEWTEKALEGQGI